MEGLRIDKRAVGISLVVVLGVISPSLNAQRGSLPALGDGPAPKTLEELWAEYDPRAEPLEIEILKEWEEADVVLRIVRYRIGTLKGQKATMAAVYGYPKVGRNLPGLVQIHGGGQYADYRAVLMNAKRGYATISIAWAGRINAPGYHVNPDIVKLFWDGKTDDPRYKLTTDWGAVDGYHAPGRNPGNVFSSVRPASWTIDEVESPRNSGWFLCALAARRALTFLEQQSQVDPDRLGVYGHSMGGKLTVMTAVDSRVKAAAPSCGGISDRYNSSPLFRTSLGDDVNLRQISCPIVFLSPSNDFHGRINHLPVAVQEIQSRVWRVICSPHHNHQDTPEYEVATQLWFDQHLKGAFTCPDTPKTSLDLNTADGVPSFTVEPDASRPVLYVDVYYTQQGQEDGEIKDRENRINRFWHHARARRNGTIWTADLPLFSTNLPLWVYANVAYPLDTPITAAGYYYGSFTAETFNLSSLVQMVTPNRLQTAGVRATSQPSLTIETFTDDWEKEWFTYLPEEWARRTHKVYDAKWRAPAHARLALEVRAVQSNRLVIGIDQYAAETQLNGGAEWQSIVLSAQDFRNATGESLPGWGGIKELRLGPQETVKPKRGATNKPVTLGGAWQGTKPEFRNLCWIPGKAKH